MNLCDARVGFAITGSFCTFSTIFPKVEELTGCCAKVIPIMSEISYNTDTRFGTAEENRRKFENITNEKIIASVKDAEPIGPKKLLDVLVVAPCTGNSLAKIAMGIADTSVTMAVKSHLRNKRPIVIAVSTNDGLGNNAKNIGYLLNMKNIYIVPFEQDDSSVKENSLISDMNLIIPTIENALEGKQIQPLLKIYK